MNKDTLNEDEQLIVSSLETTQLGREGMILVDFFRAEHRATIKGLVDKKICKVEENFFSQSCLRLEGIDYPKTFDECMVFRQKCIDDKLPGA